jgi:inosine/xanthosine triphosphatase
MRVAVGSTNPVKIHAVRETFQEVFGVVEVIGLRVDSGVSSQPFKEEVIEGSVKRARNALKVTDADLGVGIEGGVMRLGERWYNLGFVAIVDREGVMGTGTSGWFECPLSILGKLKDGKELGEVMDELMGRKDTKKQEGAIGIFTKGRVSRKDLYKHGILMALAPFLSPEVFRDEG